MESSYTILLFDGNCVLCSTSVQFILRYERHHNLHFASLYSEVAKKELTKYGYKPEELNTLVLIEDGQVYLKSKAVFRLAAYLKMPLSIFCYLKYMPAFICDFIYDWIAKNRYFLFGKRNECFYPPEKDKHRFMY